MSGLKNSLGYIIMNKNAIMKKTSMKKTLMKRGSIKKTTTKRTSLKMVPPIDKTCSKKSIITGGGILSLTEVQAKSLLPGLAGRDILAKSNTGSGKTLAFLIVGVERILRSGGPDPTVSFPIVILTPITDLAMQIMNVANTLLKYHGMTADLVIGGTDEKKDLRRLSSNDRIDVLVATPGRFKSILNQSSRIKERLALCQTFVIDEADKMTDPGFLKDTRYIHSIAENSKMQTLMFSATVDKITMMKFGLLKDSAVYIDTSSNNRPQVNTKVKQVIVVTNIENHFDAVVNVVKEHIHKLQNKSQHGGSSDFDIENFGLSKPTITALKDWNSPSFKGFRIMIFLSSNAFIDYFTKIFSRTMQDVKCLSLHGNMSQHKRSSTSESFRTTDNCILITSDASARGVDYPDVSCIIQMGFDSRSEYTQRVGRTGRAGKDGEGVLIVAPEELRGVEKICDLLTEVRVEKSLVNGDICKQDTLVHIPTGIGYPVGDTKHAKNAFRGWLGSLASKWKKLNMEPHDVISLAEGFSKSLGLRDIDESRLREKLHIRK